MIQTPNKVKRIVINISFISVLFSFLFYSFTATVADPDLWGYMSFGRLFWKTQGFPYQDIFSYVPTLEPWVYHEWLTGVLFYSIYDNFGSTGLQLFKYGSAFLTLSFVYLTARTRDADRVSTCLGILAIGGLLRMGYAPVRAQVFTYLFFAVTLYLLERARKTGHWKCLWFLLPIQMVWCNLHGGFVAGLGLIVLYAIGEKLSKRPSFHYWLIFLLSGLATAINPYGVKYWEYIISAIAMPRPMITEWSSVFSSFQSGEQYGTIAYFVILNIFAVIWLIRIRPDIPSLLVSCLTLYLGWMHIRHIPLFALFFGCHFPSLIAFYGNNFKNASFSKPITNRIGWKFTTAVGILIAIYYIQAAITQGPLRLKTPDTPVNSESSMYYPVGAIDFINENHLSGKLLIHFEWGEYAIWTLYPHCSVALDGRFETVYPQNVIEEYFDFIYGNANWRTFLRKYSPDLILISNHFRIYSILQSAADWSQIYHDNGCTLFKRRNITTVDNSGNSISIQSRMSDQYQTSTTQKVKRLGWKTAFETLIVL